MARFIGDVLAWSLLFAGYEAWKWYRDKRRDRKANEAMFGTGDLCDLIGNDKTRRDMVNAFDRANDGAIGIFYANEKRYVIHVQPWVGKTYEQGGCGLFR